MTHKSKNGSVRPPSVARRLVNALMAFVLAAGTMMAYWSYADIGTAEAAAPTLDPTRVNDEMFFNSGYYLNQLNHTQDPPFTADSFECTGGHVVRTTKSDASTNGGPGSQNVYTKCQIWPYLVGRGDDDGVEGWAFIADEKNESATGASVSMTYTEVGYVKNAANPNDPGILADIKVTYTMAAIADAGHVDSYPERYAYDGHPVIHFADNFSYGTFQFGVMDMATTYEFINHDTGQAIPIDSIYYTKTSMDKGETLAVDPSLVVKSDEGVGVWISNDAADLSDATLVNPKCAFGVMPGSLLYNNAHYGHFDGMLSYSGAPHVYHVDDELGSWKFRTPPEYWDSIGSDSYYWRSVCMKLSMSGGNQLTVHHGAVGWTEWTHGFDKDDPEKWDNGGTMYTTHNFLPLTNPQPQDPTKLINGQTELVEGVGIGDTVHYDVVQPVHDMGSDGLVKYKSMAFEDSLPEYVKYKDGSAKLTDTMGQEVTGSDYSVSYDEGSNKLTVSLTEDYLQNRMIYDGGDYTLSFDVEVVDQPADDLETVKNSCDVRINGHVGTSNVVEYEPIKPQLQIEKHADLTYKLASSISEYEYLNHDENPDDFSTVHYVGYMQNITDKTRAKNVTVYDSLPAGLSLVPGSVKVTGADGIEVSEDGTSGWSATIPDLYPWTKIEFEYDCYTTTEGNGLEVVNTARTWCTNAELGTPGAEDAHTSDDGEIYVNDPNLVVKKSVAESPVQNDDYQRGEEYRVDDEFEYTVTLVNDVPGTFAKNVRLTDDDIPDGFELVGDIKVSGLDDNGKGYKIPYPIAGKSDSVHGEEETRTIEWSLDQIDNGAAWGWNLDINYLDHDRPVTVTFTVKATDPMNGFEVYNRARATADNQPNDVFWSKDARTNEDYTIVWVNSPEFDVQKDVRKTDGAYQVGDVAAYDIVLGDLKDPGTLARQTTLEDAFQTEGTTIVENSFVVTDKPENADDIRGKVELNRHVGDQSWHVDMTQVYGDEEGYWVNSEDWRPIFKDGAEGVVDGEHNPVKAKPAYDEEPCQSDDVTLAHDYFKVHYEATINDMALQNELIVNVATADSLEGLPASDDAQVTVIGAQLDIEKDSTDKGSFTVGDVAQYELTIRNNATGTTAEDVQIKDGFTTAKAGTVSIVEGSIELFDNSMRPIEVPEENIEYTRNEAGNIFGFHIDTDYDLPSSQKTTVRYDVKYLANNGGDAITNVAWTWASNAPGVSDDYVTWPDDMDQSDLHVDKGSDKTEYEGGETAKYTHHISNKSGETAINVTIHDEITVDTLGIAEVVKGSVKIWDENHEAVGLQDIKYLYSSNGKIKGFEVETGRDIPAGKFWDVEYQVRFSETAQDTQVHNEVWVAADNTGKATDEHDVTVKPGGPTDPTDPTDPVDPSDPGDAKLAIQKDSNKSFYVPGETGRYTVVVTNTAEGTTAENVTISDRLDAEAQKWASIVKGSVAVKNAMGNAVPTNSVSYETDSAGRTVGVDVATGYDLAHGDNLTMTYDVTFDEGISGKTDVRNVADATANNAPKAEADNVVTLDTEAHPELGIDKSVDKATAAPGDTLSYTVTVKELAESAVAEDTVVTDTLPDGFELDKGSVKVEKDGHQQTAAVFFPDGKIQVALGDVAYGETWTISYSGKIAEDYLGTKMRNIVLAESPSVPENPEDETVTELEVPKLEIVKTAEQETFSPGGELTWNITVKQTTKNAVATDVVVVDELPEGFVLEKSGVTVTDHNGDDRRCNVAIADGVLTVELGDLPYGDPVDIKLAGTVAEDYAGETMANTAVATAENVKDPVESTAEVPAPQPESPGEGTTEDGGNPMKGIDQTGDAFLRWMSGAWPFMLAAAALAALAVLKLAKSPSQVRKVKDGESE